MSEKLGLNLQQAQELLNKYITDPITKLHCRESEVIMRALADKFGENSEEWGIIGLLHDIDWELTKNNTKEHCVRCIEILKETGGTDYLIESIISHGYANELCGNYQNKERTTKIQHALASAETLTGLIVASALIQPDKKLSSVKLASLKKKFKNKSFAANCNRDIILECEKIGLSIDEFLEIGLTALQNISEELTL